MKKIMLPIIAVMVVMLAVPVYADLGATPLFTFEMAGYRMLPLDEAQETVSSIATIHQSSDGWLLYIYAHESDVTPYDNITLSIKCNDASTPTVFRTVVDSDWVDYGAISISFSYQDEAFNLNYNNISFDTKYSQCIITAITDNTTFIGNGAYGHINVEMIPYLSQLESYDCAQIDSFQLDLLSSMSSLVGINSDVWLVAWLVYSIGIIIVAVIGLPIFIFLLIRWTIYRITGIKIFEKKSKRVF